jgi:hypothetical protein
MLVHGYVIRVGARDTGKTGMKVVSEPNQTRHTDRPFTIQVVDATFGEILTVLSKIDYLLAHGEAAIAPESRPGNLLLAHKRSKVSSLAMEYAMP